MGVWSLVMCKRNGGTDDHLLLHCLVGIELWPSFLWYLGCDGLFLTHYLLCFNIIEGNLVHTGTMSGSVCYLLSSYS